MRKTMGRDEIKDRIKRITKRWSEVAKDIDNLHVKLQPGNKKTGINCWTVSLLPVIDCKNCSKCKWDCYDIKNDLIYPNLINDRCRNSVIHRIDKKRFWDEINMQVKCNYVTQLRINVGGDLEDTDFRYVKEIGKDNPKTMILFFTKNYDGINNFLKEDNFPKNVHPIMSVWHGMKMENPNKLPEAHVLYPDGKTTAPEYGAVYCSGNCSKCAFEGNGCWNLKRGEHVIFNAH